MKKILFLFFIFCTYLNAQHTVSGTFSPAKDYNWIIAYQLKSDSQNYVVDTAIKNGEFSLLFPENTTPGTYRLVYAVPQDEFYFDIIYNGKEDIILNFKEPQGVHFIRSDENILLSTYFKEIQAIEQELIQHYATKPLDKTAYVSTIKKYQKVQEFYENSTKLLIANNFIKANKPYFPVTYESVNTYVKNRTSAYFKHIDFSNTTLQASDFINEKMLNYVLTALPLKQLNKQETEKHFQKNIDTVCNQLNGSSAVYTFQVLHKLWIQMNESGYTETSDYIFQYFLKKSPVASQFSDITKNISIQNKLRIGALPPEISWKNKGQLKKLSTLKTAENYVLVFWSSGCGHCLKELPFLHKELKKHTNVKVIAVGLEDNRATWEIESKKLDNFEHAIAIGKWESAYAKIYDIKATPTYYILDANKRIIAKPESDKEVIEFLKK